MKQNTKIDKQRQALYDNQGLLEFREVPSYDPEKHTMRTANFKKYIGTFNRTNLDLDTKKFGLEQTEIIKDAYRNGYKICVIGAYEDDLNFILEKNNAQIVGSPIKHTKKSEFNCRRQIMCKVSTTKDNKPNELWVFVFPSKYYVDQIAELIKAIVVDFSLKNDVSNTTVVVAHFPGIENNISKWTGFSDFISLFVRSGDVVIIGNVDLILPGLRDYSFISANEKFHEGGLNNMFAAKLLIHEHSYSRLVLIGCKESFWGDASAQYVKSILEAGAMHLLYGSKAAAVTMPKDIHKTFIPDHFMLLDDDGKPEKIEYYLNDISNIYNNLDITRAGFAVTVPTVIGETHEQLEKLQPTGITCMDCEDGHIAKVIAEHNQIMSKSGHQDLLGEDFKKTFFPIHFITDYIYNSNEVINAKDPSLGNHAQADPSYKQRRDSQFQKIGNAFAAYGLMFGRQNLKNKFEKLHLHRKATEESFEDQFRRIRPLLDAGLGRQALALLSSEQAGSEALGINKGAVQAIICQKDGYIDSAFTILEKYQDPGIFNMLDELEKTRIDVISLKLYSQIGSLDRMSKILSYLNKKEHQELLKINQQFGAVRRREAIYHALCNNPMAAAKSIEIAIDGEQDRRDNHYKNTNILFDIISKLPFSNNLDLKQLENISEELSRVRSIYLSSEPHSNYWQTNFEKGAIAALFLEASYYLSTDDNKLIIKGAKILTIAHLFNLWFGGNEVSETYGEIIACTKDIRIKHIISLAMRKNTRSQFLFQKWVNSKFKNLNEIAGSFTEIYRLDVKQREEAIQKLINNHI